MSVMSTDSWCHWNRVSFFHQMTLYVHKSGVLGSHHHCVGVDVEGNSSSFMKFGAHTCLGL